MKIDFHTHGKLAKNLPFSPLYTEKLFVKAKEAGLDALCLTEHFNTLGYHEVIEYLLENYPREGDSLLVEGVCVFIGMEIDISEHGHILVVGIPEEMLQLNHELEPYKVKGSFLSFRQLTERLEKYQILWGAAHPYREESHIPDLERELLKKMDFIDLNGKDYAVYGEVMEEKILAFAKELDLPVLAGSDTHQSFQYGCVYNDFYSSCQSISELKEIIAMKAYERKVIDYIDFKVETASTLKRALKALHAAGADYVAVL